MEVIGEEQEDEEIHIKYPYERKDAYEGIQERLEQRLQDSGDEELEKRAKEMTALLNQKHAEWKEEEKLERQETQRLAAIFTCVMCAKAFPDAVQLQKHTSQFHDLSGANFKCTLCGNGYKYKKNLVSHMTLHNKEHQCAKCSLVFQTAETLRSHEVRHHKEETQEEDDEKTPELKKCQYCQTHIKANIIKRHEYYCLNKEKIAEKRKQQKAQSVPSSPALSTISCTSFMSYQPGPSSFRSPLTSPVVSYRDKSCSVCGETFASRQSMLRHVGRKHPEVKDDPNVTAVRYVSTESPTHQYACTDCGKRLTTRAALTTHRLRAHSNSQRHECSICQKTYTVPSELRKHIQRVHENSSKSTSSVTLDELPDIDDVF